MSNIYDKANEVFSSQRVFLALKEVRTKLEEFERSKNERVAIIGMAGRFPGAQKISEFWQNIRNGNNSITFLSAQELLSSGIDPAVLNDPNYVKAYSSLEDIEFFDASFFGYSPREAEIIDPQHRIFLECAWEALENAGYDTELYKGSIGFYAGTALNSYIINLYSNRNFRESLDNVQVVVGNVMGLMPTRVSYKLNLKGPSCGVQTGCSTSLVSVHLACLGLLNGECDIALAGGVSVSSLGKSGYLYKEEGVLSPDGYCRAFDAKAGGTVFGNGVGIVVLKRLTDALADRDCIYAVIKGSAINNDGAQKVGFTAPSVTGQAKVIEEALAKAGVEPETINYIETHGTGTALGDPVEIAALTKVFCKSTENKGFCAVGSVKTNIGHLDAAAGVAGLIKTVLALKHQQIPPSLHFHEPNPQIDFANSPFYVNTKLANWQKNGTPRRAGVSSFGMGGTNAHAIVEEAPTVEDSSPGRTQKLLLLSAKTSSALDTATTNLAAYLKQHPDLNLADVAYTLQVGRRPFNHRRMLVCKNITSAVQALEFPASPASSLPTTYDRTLQELCYRPVTFMFSGQGSQYINMGQELYQTEPTFREQVDRCCELLNPHLGLDLRHIIYPIDAEVAAQQLLQTALAQPALFVVEYALAKLWMAWGVQPQATIGHSIGEYVAAAVAGVFSLEDALALVAARGRLMQQCPPGAMLSVPLAEEKVKPLVGLNLALAASNAPELCVVSGTTAAINELQNCLTQQGVECRRLHTSHAFHSPMMEPILEQFKQQVSLVSLSPPKLPFLSNVTGTWITAAEATDPNYWANHIRQTVRFAAGSAELVQKPNQILLEVGPGRTLSTFAKQYQLPELLVLTSLRHQKEQQSDVAFILNTLGRLWLAGVEIDWSGFYAQERRHRLPLPTYPFERQRYWIQPQKDVDDSQEQYSKQSKKPDIADWFYLPSWKRFTLLQSLPAPTLANQKMCWLVLVDNCGLGLQLVQRLEQEGQDVITVKAGEQFSRASDGVYTINPQEPHDYEALLQALQTLDKTPQMITHMWGVTAEQESNSMDEFIEFYSLLFLAQALSQQNTTAPVQIAIVTNNLHDVVGTEQLSPAKATVLGPCKVIPQEYPHITCRNIDVVVPESDTFQLNKFVEQLMVELWASPSAPVVAYRDRNRWVQTFEPLQLPKIDAATRLREGGVYLIAGDFVEGLGLVFAKYLAQIHAKLILIGRSELPERNEWEQWLATHGQHDAVSRCIRKMQALELGTEFLFVSADIADEAQMQAVVTQAYERFGQINGVIHAAAMGERSTCPIQKIDRTECDRQFRAKVQGLIVLEKVLQGKQLDFYLLQSSLSSVVAGVGFVAYTAANLFMDAFANQRSKCCSSIPWISVNWDACHLEEPATNTDVGATLVDLAMMPKEIWDVSERILSTTVPQIVVSPGELQTRIDQWIKPKSFQDLEQLQATKAINLDSSHSRPNLHNPYVAPRNEIEHIVTNVWQELLGIEQVGVYDNFFELGGHSLLAIQAISRLREEFQVDLPMRQFLFESPTVAGIAKVIAENQSTDKERQEIAELLEQVESMKPDEVQAKLAED